MKSRTMTQTHQPHHISPIAIHPSFNWHEEQKPAPRSRLADSFNFMMGLIDAEPYPTTTRKGKETKSTGQFNIAYRAI